MTAITGHVDLALLRATRGRSLEEIAASTKISIRYLRAIEESRFELLPQGVYAASYLRQYARALDFDEEDLLGFYRSRCRPIDSAPEDGAAPVSRFARVTGWLLSRVPSL